MAALYRKKPVVIEAIQWDGTRESLAKIADWLVDNDFTSLWIEQPDPDDSTSFIVKICTLEGWMQVSVDDFVIKGIQGEFYPCKPDIFEATYELVAGA